MEHTEGLNIFAPDMVMLLLTWATFAILLFILGKFAWKPILTALDQREADIRKSLEDADKAKAHLQQVEQTKAQILNDAKTQASEIINSARKTANDLAHQIEQKAREQAEQIISGAHQEIEGERQRVKDSLRRESAKAAVVLAEKILKENLDTEKNRKLIDEAIKDV